MNSRADKLRAEIARLRDLASKDTKWAAQYLRDLAAASAELAGIEAAVRARPVREVAKELGIHPKTLQRRAQDAGIRAARIGRSLVLTESEVAAVVQFSRSRNVYWKDPPSLRPPPREPKRPLTREEQGRRIREGKARARRWRITLGLPP